MSTSWQTFDPRAEFGKALVELGAANPDCMVIAADLARTCNTLEFREAYPDRFLNVGVCEQNMVGMSAGLAFEGKVPIVTSICPFIYMRACEQVRTDVCYNNLHVIFVSVMGGISGAPLGSTHYGTEDLAVMRSFPNMTVLHPASARQIRQAIFEASATNGPVYVRLGSGAEPDVPSPAEQPVIGRAVRLRDGADVSILATGYMVHKALEAAAALSARGISAAVWNHPSIKPIDAGAVREAATGLSGSARPVVTVEEHNLFGGFGGAIAEELSAVAPGAPLLRLALPDVFVGVGNRDDLLQRHGLDSGSIAERIRRKLTEGNGGSDA